MTNDFMNPKKGFAPIVIILAVVILLGVGVSGFVLLSKNKTSSSPPPSPQTETTPSPPPSNQAPETEIPPLPTAANPTELLGWWEEEGGFPFLKEFTKHYSCNQYDAKFHCVKNMRYVASGDKLAYEGTSADVSEKWKLVGGKLEITQFSRGKQMGSTSVYKKVSEPTSPDRELPGSLQANLELVKANTSGICLRHNGGDIVYVGDIVLTVDGKNIPVSTFGQFPKFEDFLFSSGEALVLPGTFNTGSRVSIKLARNILGTTPSFTTTESGSWTIEMLVVEPFPNSVSAPFWFGFASCP